jgi:hypothetical protein
VLIRWRTGGLEMEFRPENDRSYPMRSVTSCGDCLRIGRDGGLVQIGHEVHITTNAGGKRNEVGPELLYPRPVGLEYFGGGGGCGDVQRITGLLATAKRRFGGGRLGVDLGRAIPGRITA